MSNATKTAKRSDFKKYFQFMWRSLNIQASWNYERQMNMGFLYGIAPTLDELYPNENDPEQLAHKKEAYEREMAFYNCTPQTSAFTLGLAASMEEQYAADRENFNPETINAVKTSLMGPLSGVGDSFFQGTVRLIAFGLGISLAQQGSVLGPILAMIISIVPAVLVTWFAGKLGYTMGSKYLTKLNGGMMDKLMYVCGIVGLMVIGAMVASMVGLTTPITFASTGLVLQDVLNSILPNLLNLGIVMLMYTLIRKKVKTGWLLCICIVFVPMFFLEGVSRFLFVPMAEAVMFAMTCSFVLSRTLVPTMAKYLLRPHAAPVLPTGSGPGRISACTSSSWAAAASAPRWRAPSSAAATPSPSSTRTRTPSAGLAPTSTAGRSRASASTARCWWPPASARRTGSRPCRPATTPTSLLHAWCVRPTASTTSSPASMTKAAPRCTNGSASRRWPP